jgi:hypothetical protein
MGDSERKHGEPGRKRAVRNVGAFVDPSGVGGGIPVPMRTLNDEYHDEPAEPEDSDRVPEAEPPGFMRRIIERLTRRRTP